MNAPTSFWAELKRRNVVRVAAAYGVVAWLVVQVGDILADNLGFPGWFMPMLFVLLGLGFPIALVLSWAFELTPEGVKKTADVAGEGAHAPPTGRRIDRLIVAGLVAVIALLVVERVWFAGGGDDRLADADTDGEVAARSIAVLPFADLSPEGDQEYFSDGLAEEILNLLADVRDLSVASRTSAFSFKGSSAPIPEIAGRLGVNYILEGSVRRADDRIRVTAQLIDARTDRHLWSENYDRTLADVFAVQDEIAAAIGEALQIELLGRSGETVSATEIAPTLYEKFLQSRFLLRQRSQAAIARATALLEEVVEGEPTYAPALAQLAEAHLVGGTIEEPEAIERRLDLIMELVERGLSIDSLLAGAYAVRGNVAMVRGAYVDALHDFQRAIDLDPEDPRSLHWLALLYSDAGHLYPGEEAIVESLRLDPENANAQGWLAGLLAARGDWDAALEIAQEVVELGNPVGHVDIAMYLLAVDPARNLDRAESELRLALAKGAPPDEVPLKLIEFVKGNESALQSLLVDVRANRMFLYKVATGLLVLDQREALLTLLEWDPHMYARLVPLVWSSDHASLRRDPRFVPYLRGQGVTDLWREIGPPPDCRAEGDTYRCGFGG